MSYFRIATPALSRGTADRSEDLRHPDRVRANWPAARVLVLGRDGGVALDGDTSRLRTVPAGELGPTPPRGAVLLGSVDGVDHWAVRGEVSSTAGLRALGATLSDTDAGLLTTATAMLGWNESSKFCPRCGAPSTSDGIGWTRDCERGHRDFPRTDPAVIVLVHDGADAIVLARQPVWPRGRMSVLAGFVEPGESLEGTVVREVHEEVGVLVEEVTYLGSQPWPFPRSLMVGFAARAPRAVPLVPRDGEIEAAQWVDRDTVRRLLQRPSSWATAPSSASAGAGIDAPPGPPSASELGTARAMPRGGPAAGVDLSQITLPDPVSIARRMIQGWVDSAGPFEDEGVRTPVR